MGLIAADAGLTGLEFQTQTVVEGIALGLLNVDQNIFIRLVAIGVLHSRVHLVEESQVIEVALRVQHVLLAQRGLRNYA